MTVGTTQQVLFRPPTAQQPAATGLQVHEIGDRMSSRNLVGAMKDAARVISALR